MRARVRFAPPCARPIAERHSRFERVRATSIRSTANSSSHLRRKRLRITLRGRLSACAAKWRSKTCSRMAAPLPLFVPVSGFGFRV